MDNLSNNNNIAQNAANLFPNTFQVTSTNTPISQQNIIDTDFTNIRKVLEENNDSLDNALSQSIKVQSLQPIIEVYEKVNEVVKTHKQQNPTNIWKTGGAGGFIAECLFVFKLTSCLGLDIINDVSVVIPTLVIFNIASFVDITDMVSSFVQKIRVPNTLTIFTKGICKKSLDKAVEEIKDSEKTNVKLFIQIYNALQSKENVQQKVSDILNNQQNNDVRIFIKNNPQILQTLANLTKNGGYNSTHDIIKVLNEEVLNKMTRKQYSSRLNRILKKHKMDKKNVCNLFSNYIDISKFNEYSRLTAKYINNVYEFVYILTTKLNANKKIKFANYTYKKNNNDAINKLYNNNINIDIVSNKIASITMKYKYTKDKICYNSGKLHFNFPTDVEEYMIELLYSHYANGTHVNKNILVSKLDNDIETLRNNINLFENLFSDFDTYSKTITCSLYSDK